MHPGALNWRVTCHGGERNPPLAQTRPCFSFLGWVELTPEESRVVQEMPQPAAAGVYRLGGAGGNPTLLCWDQSCPRPPAACCDRQPPGEAEPPNVTSCALPEGFHCLPFYFGGTNLQPPPLPALGVQNPFAGKERKPNQATGSFKSLGEFGIIFPMILCFCFCFLLQKKCTCSSSHRYIYIYLLYLRLFFDGGTAGEDVS